MYPFRTEEIQQPTICVVGQDDTVLPKHVAIWVHHRLPHSTLYEIPNVGHMDLIDPSTPILPSIYQELIRLSITS